LARRWKSLSTSSGKDLVGTMQYTVFGEMYPQKVICEEVKCIVKGDEYCEFVVRRFEV